MIVKRPKYILQPIFAILGGIILVLVNAVGDPGIYAQIVAYLKTYGYITEEQGTTILNVLYFIAYLGGFSVLIGGLIYLTNAVFPARFMISVGAGISASVLALRVISLGPTLKEAIAQGRFTESLQMVLGVGVGLRLLGTLLALLALLSYYVPIILGALSSVGYFISGATISLHVSGPYASSLQLMGVIVFVIGVLGSAGYVTLYRILSALALVFYIPSFVLRTFGGFFDRRSFAFAIEAMFFNILMIVRSPKIYEKLRRRGERIFEMYVLGLEGTAHTAGVGAFSLDGELLLNLREQYTSPSGGIHPRESAQFIAQRLPKLVEKAFDTLGTDVVAIGFSRGPGLGPCLRTVATAARFLASVLEVPLYGVNHAVAHIEIGRREHGFKEPIALYLSGGNTAVVGREGRRYVVYGETLDIGLGNLLDTFAREAARILGITIPFPGGPHIERFAQKGSRYYDLPYVVKGMNLSFSGLLKAAIELLESGVPIEDVAYSLQETAFAMVIEVLERALGFTGKKEALLVGGVARNKRLRKMFEEMAEDRNIKHGIVSPELAVDNGAMIAYVALEMYKAGMEPLKIEESYVIPKRRMEEFELPPPEILPR